MDKRKPVQKNIRLEPEMEAWLVRQDTNISATIRRLIREAMAADVIKCPTCNGKGEVCIKESSSDD